MRLRDESAPIRDADIWAVTNVAQRVGRPVSRGACACGRMIVGRFTAESCGTARASRETHARRRCVFRKAGAVVSGAKW